jgi:hypothetical protein
MNYFLESDSLPTMRSAVSRDLALGGDLVLSDTLAPLAFGIYQITVGTDNPNVRDTVHFLITNAFADLGSGGLRFKAETFTLSVSQQARTGYLPVTVDNKTLLYYTIIAPNESFCASPLVGGNATYSLATNSSPRRYVNDGASDLLFPVGSVNELIQTIDLWIYTSSMTRIREIHYDRLQPQYNQLGVLWDGRDYQGDLVNSGVYIYEISINGGEPIVGKFAVIRR